MGKRRGTNKLICIYVITAQMTKKVAQKRIEREPTTHITSWSKAGVFIRSLDLHKCTHGG